MESVATATEQTTKEQRPDQFDFPGTTLARPQAGVVLGEVVQPLKVRRPRSGGSTRRANSPGTSAEQPLPKCKDVLWHGRFFIRSLADESASLVALPPGKLDR